MVIRNLFAERFGENDYRDERVIDYVYPKKSIAFRVRGRAANIALAGFGTGNSRKRKHLHTEKRRLYSA